MDFAYIWSIVTRVCDGLGNTTLLFFITILASLPLGFIVMLLAKSKIKIISVATKTFIYVMRSTPLMLQLMFIYFGLPFLPVVGEYLVLQRFNAAIVGFILNYSAYFAEIFRGGLLAVSKGQYEASYVLGLSKWQTMTRIVIPQMLRVSMPSVSNETITLVKDTSLMYAVSVPEVLHFTKTTVNATGDTFAFVVAAVIYLVFNAVVTFVMNRIEKRMEY